MIISFIVAKDVLAGTLLIGDFVLVNSYLIMLFNALEVVTGHIRNVVSHAGDLSHSISLLNQSQTIEDQPNAPDLSVQHGNITFNAVSFGYNYKNAPIIHQLNLDIKAQSTVAIVGASGSGKSTITRLLFRFYDLDDGSIMIDNQNIKTVTKASLRSQIAFVPQDIVLLNTTIEENIRYGSKNISAKALNAMIKTVQLEHLIKRLPEGLQTIVGERGLKVSGGEKQRIAIARALLKQTKIIVFDEATSSLDTKTEKIIQQSIFEKNQDKTTIIIAHRLSSIEQVDRIIVLDKGTIVEQGTHQQLLKDNGHYAKLWGAQHEKK